MSQYRAQACVKSQGVGVTAYYNEFDSYAAQWLRNLIQAGHIAPGYVDERSILDVAPSDLAGYTQCHFFAGIGVWSHALRGAGWADESPVWTGSCPCQPFSSAGAGAAFADERHLWPHFHWLIEQCQPTVVLGEQVASKDAGPWLDLVQADMEATGYAFGAVAFPAASVGAPHIRDRLYWVADSDRCGQSGSRVVGFPCDSATHANRQERRAVDVGGGMRMADANEQQWHGRGTSGPGGRTQSTDSGADSRLDDPKSKRPGFFNPENVGATDAQVNLPADTSDCQSDQSPRERLTVSSTSPTDGFWRDADWLLCRDGKWRPVEPGTFPLAHGLPPEWDDCAPTETPSALRKRNSSSKP